MMLGVPAGLMGTSAPVGAGSIAVVDTNESGGASGGSSEVGGPSPTAVPVVVGSGVIEESERSGGNRWPRQETLALLKIRSDMGAVFRDANLKGPLWEVVSRKMAELGFHRSAKKCKEKFENVYKYHKRTKDGRASKPDSKSYRFFDQLEAFETTTAAAVVPPNPTALQIPSNVTVSASTSPTPLSMVPPMIQNNPTTNTYTFPFIKQPQNPPPTSVQHPVNTPFQAPSSSSTSSDEDIQRRQRGKKRKWKEYFVRLTREVVQRQEELQNKFLEALDRAERDRSAREDAWRAQETARMRRERDLLLQERSMTEAKDTAVISFLKKITNEPNFQLSVPRQPPPPPPPAPPLTQLSTAIVPVAPRKDLESTINNFNNNNNNNGDGFTQASSSRWPKAEVEALIKLRTNLDIKYQESGPKGPLWEEISGAMAKLGYSRNPKRCKEKWENINKYYKKVKESNRKRPEDSKTCPYFQLLEEIYKEKAVHNSAGFPIGFGPKPDDSMAPIMARPEQQWPSAVVNESDQNDEDEDEDEDDDGGGYEMISNNPIPPPQQQPSPVANTAE